jgi:glutaredoxin
MERIGEEGMHPGIKTKKPATKKKGIITFIVILSALVFYLCGMATAEMYRWVDENGETQITDSPPPNIKSRGEIKIYRDIPQDSHNTEPALNARRQEPNSAIETKKNPEVILYGTSWCPYCVKARDFFRSRGIDFTDYDIEKDKEAATRKRQLDKKGGVPFVIINGRSISGFSASAYERALQE